MENVPPVSEISTSQLKSKTPGEVRLLAIPDPHMACSSPASWKADYKKVLEATIEQVLLYGSKQDVDAVIWPGDLFHRKSPGRNPLWFVEDVMDLMTKYGLLNAGVGGNHDFKHGSLDGLKGQPLSVLVRSNVLQLLDRTEFLFDAGAFTVRLAGSSFKHGHAEECRDKKKRGANWLVVAGHFWFGTTDGMYNGEPMMSPDYFKDSEADVFVIGHKHDDQGVVEKWGKKFVAPGSISLTGEKVSDNSRRPAAAYIVITKEAVSAWVLRPKVPPIVELVDVVKREQKVKENQALEEFVVSISGAKLSGINPKDILGQMDVTQDVRTKVEFYLDSAEQKYAT